MLKRSVSVLLCIVFLVSMFSVPTIAFASTATPSSSTINEYIDVNYWYVSSSTGKIKVRYTVKKDITNNYFDFKIRYDWPAYFRVPGKYVNLESDKGTYTAELPAPAKCGGYLKLYIDFNAYTHSEEKLIDYYFSAPDKVYTRGPHIITKSQELAGKFTVGIGTMVATFGLGGTFPMAVKITSGVLFGYTFYDSFIEPFAKGPPMVQEGQVWYIRTWYANGKQYIRKQIWNDQLDYNQGDPADWDITSTNEFQKP